MVKKQSEATVNRTTIRIFRGPHRMTAAALGFSIISCSDTRPLAGPIRSRGCGSTSAATLGSTSNSTVIKQGFGSVFFGRSSLLSNQKQRRQHCKTEKDFLSFLETNFMASISFQVSKTTISVFMPRAGFSLRKLSCARSRKWSMEISFGLYTRSSTAIELTLNISSVNLHVWQGTFTSNFQRQLKCASALWYFATSVFA
mmetsp:Transcript_46792/g.124233  ORF Transcript_46792/g.124233 Transcript_46792/m.124233 type:complete len:200 (-) Transcript_46792:6287-6886(-)